MIKSNKAYGTGYKVPIPLTMTNCENRLMLLQRKGNSYILIFKVNYNGLTYSKNNVSFAFVSIFRPFQPISDIL